RERETTSANASKGMTMKTAQRVLLPLAIALSAGAAMAEGTLQGNEVFNFQSQQTRAEVQAQAAQANRAGLIARGEAQPEQAPVVASVLSRAQVRAEAAEANRLGLTAVGDVVPEATPAQLEQIRHAGLRAVGKDTVLQAGQAAVN